MITCAIKLYSSRNQTYFCLITSIQPREINQKVWKLEHTTSQDTEGWGDKGTRKKICVLRLYVRQKPKIKFPKFQAKSFRGAKLRIVSPLFYCTFVDLNWFRNGENNAFSTTEIVSKTSFHFCACELFFQSNHYLSTQIKARVRVFWTEEQQVNLMSPLLMGKIGQLSTIVKLFSKINTRSCRSNYPERYGKN